MTWSPTERVTSSVMDELGLQVVEGSVICADVRDLVPAAAQLQPGEVTELFVNFLNLACSAVLKFRGEIDKLSGSAMVGVFIGGSDHPRRALSCALLLAQASIQVSRWARYRFPDQTLPDFNIAVGVHSGQLAFAPSEDLSRTRPTSFGATVNIASQLQRESGFSGAPILASLFAIDAAGAGFVTLGRRSFTLSDSGRQIEVLEVKAADSAAQESNVAAEPLPEALQARLARAAERVAQSVVTKPMTTISRTTTKLTPVAAPIESPAKVQVKGFNVFKKIEQGGMATVYLAQRTSDEATVVLKIFDAKNHEKEELLHRFILEHGTIAKIKHPNIVTIHEQGFTDDFAYISMEYFPGGDLKALIKAGVSQPRIKSIAVQILLALEVIHGSGIVHRDLKPENIMFRANGDAVLVDFGIAKDAAADMGLTGVGRMVGSPYYMSPEQIRAETVDRRSDLYSFGVMLFQMLAGKRPFTGADLDAILTAHVNAAIPRLPASVERFQPLLDRLLAKNSADRFNTAADALAALDAV